MSSIWEQEAAKVLREAEALFDHPHLGWFENALSAFDGADSLVAWDRLLQQAMDPFSGAISTDSGAAQGGPSEDPPSEDASADPWAASSAVSSGGIPLRGSVPRSRVPWPSPLRRSDPPMESAQGILRESADRVMGNPLTKADAMRNGPVIPRSPKASGAAPILETPRNPLVHLSPGADPRRTRLVTELSDLQGLFRTVVAGEQRASSLKENESLDGSMAEPRESVGRSLGASAPAQAILGSSPGVNIPSMNSHPITATSNGLGQDSFEGGVEPQDRFMTKPAAPGSLPSVTGQVAELHPPGGDPYASLPFASAQEAQTSRNTPFPLLRAQGPRPGVLVEDAKTALSLQGQDLLAGGPWMTADPLWEAALFDRMMDRLEERLREQSIRHLGFTGGLI